MSYRTPHTTVSYRSPHTTVYYRSPHTTVSYRSPHTTVSYRSPHTTVSYRSPHTTVSYRTDLADFLEEVLYAFSNLFLSPNQLDTPLVRVWHWITEDLYTRLRFL